GFAREEFVRQTQVAAGGARPIACSTARLKHACAAVTDHGFAGGTSTIPGEETLLARCGAVSCRRPKRFLTLAAKRREIEVELVRAAVPIRGTDLGELREAARCVGRGIVAAKVRGGDFAEPSRAARSVVAETFALAARLVHRADRGSVLHQEGI